MRESSEKPGRWVAAAITLLAFSPTMAEAIQQYPSDSKELLICEQSSLRLEGASSLPIEDGSATFPDLWIPELERLASCAMEREAAYSCLLVQGSFDERQFSQEVVAAFGSAEAAQLARARGRAAAVIGYLADLGVPAEKLRERPPSREPGFRGVEITWVSECLPRPAGLSEEDREVVMRARALLESPPTTKIITQVVMQEPAPSPFFVELGPAASLDVVDPSSVFSPLMRIQLGAKKARLYGRGGVGLAISSREAQRRSVEVSLGGGYQLLSWIDLGLVAGLRLGSAELGAPWLERSWFAGVEAVECLFSLWEGTSICLHQALLPLGSQTRRATIESGVLERIPPEENPLVRMELGAFLRQKF